MVFAKREEVHERDAVRTIKHGLREGICEYISYSLQKTTDDTYSKGKIGHFDAHKNKHHKAEDEDDDVKNGDTLQLDERVENEGQAKKRIKSELEKKNLKAQTARFTFVGDPLLVSGQMVALDEGFGKWAGKYVIMKSRHKFSRGGYTTDIDLGKPKAKK
jgi:phage protein D